MQTIALSKETRALLSTAALVNNSIRIEAGNMIRTISPQETVVMEAQVAETFPESFSIYELNRFQQVMSMMEGATLGFSGSDHVMISSGRINVKYKFSDASFVTHPGEDIGLPSEDLRARLAAEDLDNIRKLARVFGHNSLAFRAEGGKVHMITTTPELGGSASDNSILLEGAEATQDGLYRLLISNLVMPSGDYDLTVSAQGAAMFKSVDGVLKIMVGVEQDSTVA